MTRALRLGTLAAAVLAAIGLGALAGGQLAAGQADVVTHLVVVAHGPGEGVPHRIEYWIDAARGFARSVDDGPDGTTVHATGPDWVLDLPPSGSGTLYETAAKGAGPTREVVGRLYLLRDALRAGSGRIASQDATTEVVVMADGRSGAIDRPSGLPLWQDAYGKRTTFEYRVQEQLRPDAFPEAFFADRDGRPVDETIETSLTAAKDLAHMPLYVPAGPIPDAPLEKVLYTRLAGGRTLEQVHQLYGSDVQITANLLRGTVTLDRPGGVDIATFAGTGKLYRETWGAQVLVAVGHVVYSVSTANEATARTIAGGLRVLPGS